MSEFYKRNAALYEEFQRKEQQFLNSEKSLNSFLVTKTSNDSLQEYLRKINQRERETEEVYKNLIRQMDDMDRRTDQMFFNIEKLSILKSTMFDPHLSAWRNVQERIETPVPSYPVSSTLNVGYNPENWNILKQDSCVQTEDLFCDQCHFLLSHNTSNHKDANAFYESNIEETGINTANHPKTSTPDFNDINHAFDLTQSISEVLDHKTERDITLNASNQLKIENDIGRLTFQSERKVDMPSGRSIQTDNAKSNFELERKVDISRDSILTSNLLTDQNINVSNVVVLPNAVEEAQVVGEEIHQREEENSQPLNASVRDEPTLNESNVGTKSDDESMNHEFNFLESEKSNESYRLGEDVQNYKNSNNLSERDTGAHAGLNETITVAKKDIYPDNDLATDKVGAAEVMSHLNVKADDLRSESSMSAAELQSPLHSEPVSVESDLDDFFDKETPLTNTPAYQALLGNNLTFKVQKKQVSSDSESEDSVEKALSKAVKKPSSLTPSLPPEVQKAEPKKEMSSIEKKTDKTSFRFSEVLHLISETKHKLIYLEVDEKLFFLTHLDLKWNQK
ncbi:uncharacterized protein LOC129227790 isoform X2 [Uloborus diversus]|uniref:uncharacterized protein LOC129227790 isoform X2 n=1 Tax=Uloborus diversus TaxID=327109 RepID=UPI00240A6FA6|nr:uncharacterized protein LOC129227790 isoform X2 [Uloborus diversus]